MNILELDSFNLADAVKFNDDLNPRIWDGKKMRPEVREKLLAIAADFQESLGVSGLDVEDITVSGSNAGYTYTPHSDIDLHLVVRMPDECDDVYQELFNAKKYQYNDEHDIRIGGYDVELYVQPSDQPHVSAGVYSVAKDDWIHIPRKIAARVDDESVRNKYEDIKARIDSALKTRDTDRLRKLWDKIKEMRRSGLAQNGELGAENLAFKILRTQGDLGRLKDAIARARDAELSLTEKRKKKKKKRVTYGFGGYWYPGYAFGSGESGEGGGDGGGGESVREVALTPDGVSASTRMFLSEKDVPSHTEIIFDFMRFAVKELELNNEPVLKIKKDPQWSAVHKSFGRYRNDLGQIELAVGNRHIMDVLRTLAHELQHRKQDEREHMPADAGETGSPYENEAHVVAGILMRKYADMHPEYFKDVPMAESASGYIPKNKKEAQDPRYAMAVTQDIKPGQTGKEANKMALKTDAQGRPGLLMKTVNLREAREGAMREIIRKALPDWPDYVIKDWISSRIKNQEDLKNLTGWMGELNKMVQPNSWKLHQKMFLTFDMLSPKTRYFMKTKRQFGARNPFLIPRDEERSANAEQLVQTQGMENLPPVIMLQHANGLELMEGWHRIMAAFRLRPEGFYVNAWIGQASEIANLHESRDDGNDPLGPEFRPTMPRGTVRVDVSDVYDWYKLGQHISNMKGLGKHDFGAGPPSSIISFGDEDTEHKFIKDLEATGLDVTDIDPRDPNQPPGMRKIKTDPTYNVDEGQVYNLAPDQLIDVMYNPSNIDRRVEPVKVATIPYKNLDRLVALLGQKHQIEPTHISWSPVKKNKQPASTEPDLVESLRREFELLEDELLGEIKMTSGNLSQLAAQIPGALVGLEFEMIVPRARRGNFKDVALDFMKAMNMDSVAVGEYHGSDGYEQWDGSGWTDVNRDDDSGAVVQDWDADESVYDIDSILSFFNDGNYNSRSDLRNLKDELQAEFNEYWTSQLDVLWEEQGYEYLQDYIENNDLFDRDEAMMTARDEIIDANPDLNSDSEEFQSLLSNRVNEMEMQFVQDTWDEGSRGYSSDYDQARNEFNDEMMPTISEDDWLSAAGYRRMSDIADRFDITWPYWIDNDDDSPPAQKPSNMFTVEPDGSLNPNDPANELGLEFVSPPIPLRDVGRVMQQVQQWAAKVGAYTGKANKTSMHANISVPGYDLQNLDYLKAAILLGDEYVLREFDRIGNTYAEPAIEKIKQLVRQQPDKVKQLLDRMKTDLNARASKLIHSGETGKYTSINTKDNRIEYRSPGGDYLSDIADNPQKMLDTINRMVVTMDAALDPEKYKQEYQKKLYKVLTGQTFGREAETGAKQPTKADDKDLLNIFSRYAAGELPKQALKSFVRQAQLERSVAKGKQTGPMWWNVEWDNNRRIEVVANNEKEAVAVAAREWGINPMSAAGQSLRATPLRPYQEPARPAAGPTVFGRPSNPDGDFVIVSSTSRKPVYRFMAAGNDDADTVLLQWSRENTGDWLLRYDPDKSLGQPPVPGSTVDLQRQRAAAASTTTPAANQLWSLRLANGQEVHRFWNRNDRNEAGRYAANWLRNNGMGVSGEGFSIEPVSNDRQQQSQAADPGSLIDQGLAASGSFTGNWLIQDPDGNTIHRFGGIGNSQGDANNFAIRWLRQHPQFFQAGVTVSPEMA